MRHNPDDVRLVDGPPLPMAINAATAADDDYDDDGTRLFLDVNRRTASRTTCSL